MEEKIELQHLVCNCCGEDIGNDDYYEFNGSILCNLCFHSETVECSHCGDRIWADDNAGTDSITLRILTEQLQVGMCLVKNAIQIEF